MLPELIGIIGTILILIGFTTNDEKTIRIFDMAGSILFVIYGIMLRAYSNIILNAMLVFVHIWKLYKNGQNRQ